MIIYQIYRCHICYVKCNKLKHVINFIGCRIWVCEKKYQINYMFQIKCKIYNECRINVLYIRYTYMYIYLHRISRAIPKPIEIHFVLLLLLLLPDRFKK